VEKYKIVAIDGDGVGPEIMDATCMILMNTGLPLEIGRPLSGEAAVKAGKDPFPEEVKKMCDEADAVLFGAAGSYSIRIIIYLRWVLDNYVNIRPVVYYPGAKSPLKDPEGINFVILRENSEGLYPGREGDLALLVERLPEYRDMLGKSFIDYGPGKFAIRIVSERGVKRFVDFCYNFALNRKRQGFPGKLTCVTKSNVLNQSCALYQKEFEKKAAEFPDLTYEHYYVDDMSRRIIRYPKDLDVICTSNLFGDILSDQAAELVGGLGMAPSACVGGKTPYFEPVHGSAPKYAGKHVINPTAMILSAKMMLEYLGLTREAKSLEEAVERVYRKGKSLTYDQGGSASTEEFAGAVLRELG